MGVLHIHFQTTTDKNIANVDVSIHVYVYTTVLNDKIQNVTSRVLKNTCHLHSYYCTRNQNHPSQRNILQATTAQKPKHHDHVKKSRRGLSS